MIINTKADWSQNRGHGSAAQFSIWHCLMMLSPLETVNADVDGFDAASIAEGQNHFYVFMKTLYQDMYENPDKYIIPTAAYDEYIKTEGTDERLSDEHKMDAKENKLRMEFQQAIQFYPDYFYQLGLQNDGISKENYALIIEKSKYDKVLKALDTTHTRKDNHRRHTAIANQGIEVTEVGNKYHISCEHAQKMFIGLKILCSAPESNYKYINYLRLDYKSYYGSVPDIESVKRTMDKRHADIITLFLTMLDDRKIKHTISHFGSITSNSKWKVEFKLSSKRVFEFYAGPSYLVIHIFFKDTEALEKVIEKSKNNNPELFDWLYDSLIEKLCNCPRNKTIMFGNRSKRICGSTNKVEILDPTEDDVKKSILLMKTIREV